MGELGKQSVAIVGLGAIGAYLAAALTDCDVITYGIARPRHVDAIRSQGGIRVVSVSTGTERIVPFQNVVSDPSEIGAVDVIIVATKSFDLREAAEAMRPLLGPATVVIPTLNGLEAPQILVEVLGPSACVGGMTTLFTELLAPGTVKHMAGDELVIGALPTTRAEAVRQLMRFQTSVNKTALLRIVSPPDIRAAMWWKCITISINGCVCALTQSSMQGVMRNAATVRMIELAQKEGCEVAAAHGVTLDADVLVSSFRGKLLAFIDGNGNAKPSMTRDIEAGKQSEYEAQIGVLFRMAKEKSLSVPVIDTLYGLLLPLVASKGTQQSDTNGFN